MNKATLVRWDGSDLDIEAEYVPRYLYTTASINIYNRCILRTGGVWRFRGTKSAEFTHNGKTGHAELSWRSGRSEFWCKLTIDDQAVLTGVVTPRNFLALLIPAAVALAAIALFAHLHR